ncbi:divalent metal cation transporter [Zobellia galactanivorans]|uniref:NRAMP family divalent metal transporter n=1 Tax=Zobellia galactanivorans (strain DSM 12802 / CCUG 47099 / CIP 106680 / NCIMB 13871 / Dsij) TaxID=63186 RepID=UPI001C0666D4|nr:divalent metal cation transporter [Zobellia galactanivorans]MBU3027616.1 divalent metal cation transporter [Zobellia galactanivorans]MDO6806997.1 divalent metal cation transporter [Zobellia galactanivorans]
MLEEKPGLLKKILAMVLAFGPGIFAIGYTIGTGSVTSMIVAGSTYGMQLLWVLVLSCVFSGMLMFAYGNYALVTGETALYAFKKHLKWGKPIAILIILGVSFGQWNSLMGILGISANIIFEIFLIYFPALAAYQYELVLTIAVVVIIVMYYFLLIGKYTFFEKILVIFVTIMGLSFLVSLFMVYPLPIEVAKGLIPTVPKVEGGGMMVAAFVGTTMAAATFLSRPLFVKGKGWTIKNLKQQKRDSIIAASLVFIISASVMAVACGALFHQGQPVTKVLDMVNTLEPVAGKFALTLFFFGTLSAGLSSIFPCLLIAPILLADYQSGELDTTSKQFKIITAIACLFALIVPVFGANPIQMQIVSQVFNVFVLPLVILGIILLCNNKKLMKEHKATVLLNIGLTAALFFSIIISYNGAVALWNYF